ncbi:hypothetical protein CI109_103854 [Kwoniella shandongensis]|uniref:D-amino-acid oxidase n=1 Tax=Kwoniella shandongensis TaxID=1734106 RepID=A0A5M6C8A1_9TREE|nr:uncharacterized protein CI109_000450 [Kwoniella shandongensis]KAA5530880.1 hypothetical protein CI109_000450 [Kwoniella shandongensis]
MTNKYDVVILGSGVIGLSIARELHGKGLKVAIVAKDLPEDSNSFGFASPWAGCNWHSFETDGNAPAAQWDAITFRRLAELAKEHPELCERIPFYTVWQNEKKGDNELWFKDLVGDFHKLEASPSNPLPGNMSFGHTFSSYILHAPAYTAHLGSIVRSLGIPIYRHRLSSLDEAYNLPEIGRVDLVINASGLGAKSLIGVEDEKVYPARGQTVLVRAPEVKTCYMHVEGFMAGPLKPGEKPPPEPAYIIPRPGPEGHVILGGTYIKDDYSSLPSIPEAERILKACYNLCPALAGPNGKSWKDIEVVSHNVGLRPAREGGARLELVHREVGGLTERRGIEPKSDSQGPRRKVGVLHAYGVGSAGFQNSLGLAEKATQLALGYVKSQKTRAKL